MLMPENTVPPKIILVTGGAGYIGSHVCVELLNKGFNVVIYDNLSNSKLKIIDQIQKLNVNRAGLTFINGDIRDEVMLEEILKTYKINAVMHFAGLKSIGDSAINPIEYYDVNVRGTIALIKKMGEASVTKLIFSSSATVYGSSATLPIKEDAFRSTTNPYGYSKLVAEDILNDLYVSNPKWKIARLRYFNPVGAHESGLIGENPSSKPTNLLPIVAMVASNQLPNLNILGNDYPTIDGTGVRDYIHVVDLALGHIAALQYLELNNGMITLNLGTGKGYSVLQVVKAFEGVCGRKISCEFKPRRAGDVAECWSDPSLANSLLHWSATKNLQEMCSDTWRWEQKRIKPPN